MSQEPDFYFAPMPEAMKLRHMLTIHKSHQKNGSAIKQIFSGVLKPDSYVELSTISVNPKTEKPAHSGGSTLYITPSNKPFGMGAPPAGQKRGKAGKDSLFGKAKKGYGFLNSARKAAAVVRRPMDQVLSIEILFGDLEHQGLYPGNWVYEPFHSKTPARWAAFFHFTVFLDHWRNAQHCLFGRIKRLDVAF